MTGCLSATVLVLANHKGGCAKTTTVGNLGVAFGERGLRTLLIDADPQGNLGDLFGVGAHDEGSRLQDVLADPAESVLEPWTGLGGPGGHADAFPGGVHLVPGGDALEGAVSRRTSEPGFA